MEFAAVWPAGLWPGKARVSISAANFGLYSGTDGGNEPAAWVDAYRRRFYAILVPADRCAVFCLDDSFRHLDPL